MPFKMTVLKQLIYPQKCIVCRSLLIENEEFICEKCYKGVLKDYICKRCGRPYDLGKGYCLACKKQDMSGLERICGLFAYSEQYRKSVLRWKYSGIRKYARGYADLIVGDLALTAQLQLDGIVPVPLAPSRYRKRGFNQAFDLAKEISELSGVPVYNCLKRSRETKPQSACNKEEREKNIEGSIEINNKISFPTLKRVAIIDDIYTTGSTAKECVKILSEQYGMKDTKFFLLVVCIGG